MPGFSNAFKTAKQKNIPVFIITGQAGNAIERIRGTDYAGLPVFTCDNTTIRTAARANPTLYIIQQGTITGKWSGPDFDKAEKAMSTLPDMPPRSPEINQPADSLQQ